MYVPIFKVCRKRKQEKGRIIIDKIIRLKVQTINKNTFAVKNGCIKKSEVTVKFREF